MKKCIGQVNIPKTDEEPLRCPKLLGLECIIVNEDNVFTNTPRGGTLNQIIKGIETKVKDVDRSIVKSNLQNDSYSKQITEINRRVGILELSVTELTKQLTLIKTKYNV